MAALRCGMDWRIRNAGWNARLDAEAEEGRPLGQEQPIMETSRQRVAFASAAFAIGTAVFLLTNNPLGLLAPMSAVFLFAHGRIVWLLYGVTAIGLVGSLLIAASYTGSIRDAAVAWAAFFATAPCIGAIVAARAPVLADAEAVPARRSMMLEEAPSYPVIGPTLPEKGAPRHAPRVSITAQDDKATATIMRTVSFWGGTHFHLRYWQRQPDGSHRWVESRSEPLREPGGTRQWSGVVADIDDLRPGQLPVRTASNPPSDNDAVRAAKIVENLLGNSWAFDAAGRPTYLTPLAQTFVAVTLEEFQATVDEGHTFFKRTAHPDDYDRISATWRHSLKTGEPFFLDRRIRRASGIHEWNRTGFVPTRDRQGRITGWYGSTIDLDSHRIAEAELRERERELSQLVDMVPSHIWRLTPDGEPVFFNKRMVDFLGLDIVDTDKLGMSRLDAVIETVHPSEAAAFRSVLNRCLVTGETFVLRYRLRRRDGVYRWMSSRAEPLRDESGRIVQWYGLCHDIDDHVHAEEALRQSEWRLRNLIDALPAMIWSTSPEGTPTYVNKRFTDVIGATVDGIIGSDGSPSLDRIIHPDDIGGAMAAIKRSFTTGVPYVMQYRQLRRGGSYRWTETRAEPLRDLSGNILQWYGVSVDIHDLIVAQATLQDRERRLRERIDAVPVHFWTATPQGLPSYINKRAQDRVGINLADFEPLEDPVNAKRLQQEIFKTHHPEDAARVQQSLARSFHTGESHVVRHRRGGKDGVYRWTESRLEPQRDKDGNILQWCGVSIDIDDAVRAQEALRQREQELSQLVNMVPVYIRRLTPEGEPNFFNKRLTDFIGMELAEIAASGAGRLHPAVMNFVHPDEAPDLLATVRHSVTTGEGYAKKYRLRRADGVYRWVETRAEPIRNPEGAITQWYVISLDIDDEVRAQEAEEALRQASDKLAKATQAANLAELSASIAHEVNQPLAAIVANSHACERWLSANPPNIERAKITTERIIRDANSAAEVVSRIRALFRQSVEQRSSTTLSSVIAEARNLMAEEVARRRVRMDVDVESNLPLIVLDRVQIQQVLINLIRNGIDAMDFAAGDRALAIRVHRMGDVIQTEVSDHGRGIESPDKIFEPFFTTKENGMGMGLAICRSIVESHGGRLWAEKNEHRGATFIFTLPVEVKKAP